jgi:hypothetical protein
MPLDISCDACRHEDAIRIQCPLDRDKTRFIGRADRVVVDSSRVNTG